VGGRAGSKEQEFRVKWAGGGGEVGRMLRSSRRDVSVKLRGCYVVKLQELTWVNQLLPNKVLKLRWV